MWSGALNFYGAGSFKSICDFLMKIGNNAVAMLNIL
jgi:hypothetical protein